MFSGLARYVRRSDRLVARCLIEQIPEGAFTQVPNVKVLRRAVLAADEIDGRYFGSLLAAVRSYERVFFAKLNGLR